MLKFETQYREPIRYLTEPGTREKIIYKSRWVEGGVLEVFEAGKENLYDYIQSHAQSVDINVILSRFNNGDVSALSRVQGVFGDFTNLPTTFVEVLNLVNSGREYFESLPVDVRAKYSHSFEKFIAALDDPDFLRDIVSQAGGADTTPSASGEPVAPAPPAESTEV